LDERKIVPLELEKNNMSKVDPSEIASKPKMHIPQFRSFVDKSDYAFIEPVFENNYIAEGPFARKFHDALLELTGSPYGVFACNGTLAIYLALKALGIESGDELIVQNITFIASANAVEMVGATPVFADTKSFDDMTIDLDKIKVTPKTKGIVVAHLFGTPCSNIEEVKQFCDDHKILLIEDASQTIGITDGETHLGTIGDVGTYSFYADKTITTAEGGFVVTPHEEVYNKMVYLRNQGRVRSGTFVHPEIGYNFRITDMQAALGLSQLGKLDLIRKEKKTIFDLYQKYLGGDERVTFLKVRSDYEFIPFRVVVFVENAENTMKHMNDQGIEPRSVFYPLHQQPCYEHLGYSSEDFPNSVECFHRGICLPTWIGLTEEQIEYTSKALLESLG
jgi:perosamine synthetase